MPEINLFTIVVYIVAILIALTVHEFMHAYVGYKLGDTTAEDEGRLSLNPIRHIDPFMTILLPIIALYTIGAPILAAKPVPFNPGNLKYEEFGAAMLAFAGPLSNLVLAVLGVLAAGFVGDGTLLYQILELFIKLNVAIFVFNLIPIPPLDGSRVLYAFAPEPLQRIMEQLEFYGFFIIIALVFLTPFGALISDINQLVLNLVL